MPAKKARPCSEVMFASALSDVRGRLAKIQQMIELNNAVANPTPRERERFTRLLEAMGALRAAAELTVVTLP